LVNSRLGLCTAAPSRLARPAGSPTGAPLLPKLRGQLAEFLDEGALAHLGALTPTHQCRFAVRARACSPTRFSCPSRPTSVALTAVSTPAGAFSPRSPLRGAGPHPSTVPCPVGTARLPPGVRMASSHARGAGILTGCPSPTPRGLGLGPPNPTRMTLPSESSGFRWADFASAFTLLMPAFALPCPPPRLPAELHRCRERSPTTTAPVRRVRSFGGRLLSPDPLSAPPHSTSELLRTLQRMAASKPTSWLSERRDFLCHSAVTWGP
jgi:hypothetical protein